MEKAFATIKNNPLAALLTAVIFLFPLGMSTVKSWSSILFYLTALLCLVSLGKNWHPQNRHQWQMLLAFSIFFGTALLSLINADDLSQGVKRIEKLYGMLLFVPMLMGLGRFKRDFSRTYLTSLVFAGVAMAAVAYVSVEINSLPRAKGFYHPIVFGDLAMLTSLILGAGLLTGALKGWWRGLAWFSFSGALFASILSGTRGGWPALPVIGLLLLWLYREKLKSLKTTVVLGILLGGLISSPFLLKETLGAQISRTVSSIELFIEGKNQNTSLGQRLLMWGIALDMWRDHPVIGSGLGDFRHDTKAKMAKGETVLKYDHGHAHNIFLEYLATTGLLGALAMVLAIFVIPFRLFYDKWRQFRFDEKGFPALAGMVTIVAFFVFGLSEGWLARSVFVMSYLMSLLVFYASLPEGVTDEQG